MYLAQYLDFLVLLVPGANDEIICMKIHSGGFVLEARLRLLFHNQCLKSGSWRFFETI